MKKENICTSVNLKSLNLSKIIKNKMEWNNDSCNMDICKIGEALVIVPTRISSRVTQELTHEDPDKSIIEISGDGNWGEDTVIVKVSDNIIELLEYLTENTYTRLAFREFGDIQIVEF